VAASGADPLQPDLFRLLPIPPLRLALNLLGASAVGVLPLVTLATFASLVLVALRLGSAAVIVSIVGMALSLAFVIALSKVVVHWFGMAVESRLGLELAAIQYALLICLSFIWLPIGVVAAQGGPSGAVLTPLPSIGEIARLLPTGWSVGAVEAARPRSRVATSCHSRTSVAAWSCEV
jgi:ABC-2 type transport system permease protein